MSQVEIREATFRDVCFVAANMRDEDWREIFCQLPDGADAIDVAALCFDGSEGAWCAWLKGSPTCAFGFAPLSLCGTVWSAWAFGSSSMRRTVPAVSRFLRKNASPFLLERGARRLEVRSVVEHDIAHQWLEGLGGERDALLQNCGKHGETFVLWSWTTKQ